MLSIIKFLRYLLTGARPGEYGQLPANWQPSAYMLRQHNRTMREIRG